MPPTHAKSTFQQRMEVAMAMASQCVSCTTPCRPDQPQNNNTTHNIAHANAFPTHNNKATPHTIHQDDAHHDVLGSLVLSCLGSTHQPPEPHPPQPEPHLVQQRRTPPTKRMQPAAHPIPASKRPRRPPWDDSVVVISQAAPSRHLPQALLLSRYTSVKNKQPVPNKHNKAFGKKRATSGMSTQMPSVQATSIPKRRGVAASHPTTTATTTHAELHTVVSKPSPPPPKGHSQQHRHTRNVQENIPAKGHVQQHTHTQKGQENTHTTTHAQWRMQQPAATRARIAAATSVASMLVDRVAHDTATGEVFLFVWGVCGIPSLRPSQASCVYTCMAVYLYIHTYIYTYTYTQILKHTHTYYSYTQILKHAHYIHTNYSYTQMLKHLQSSWHATSSCLNLSNASGFF